MRALSLLLACTAEPDGPSPQAVDEDTGQSGWQRAEPAWTADDALAALEQGIDDGFPDPFAPRDLYLEMLGHADASCPTGAEDGDITATFSGCVTETYWLFSGIAVYEEAEATETEAGFSLYGDAYIMDADRNVFSVAGQIYWNMSDDGAGERAWDATVIGTWSYALASTWVGGPGSVATWMWGSSGADGTIVHVAGSLQWRQEIYFDELHFDSTCGEQPTGTLRVRGDDDYWYTLQLPDDCSGCGELSFAGETRLGEACVDLSPARDRLLEEIEQSGGL